MKTFREWYKVREMSSTTIGSDASSGTSFSGAEGSQMKASWKLADLAWAQFPIETKTFFGRLANKHPDVKALLDQIEGDGLGVMRRASKRAVGNDHQDEIVPPQADTGSGGEMGND